MYALLDGNNFYVSCERAFQPALRSRAVVVLSNNDGCVISRSEEAKELGIPMGMPFFHLRSLQYRSVTALSANFALYGDMSRRMMQMAATLGPTQEIYSIDECFIGGLQHISQLTERAHALRSRIYQGLGIACGIGIAPTKTLAKLCNHIAKQGDRKKKNYPDALTEELARVCNWQDISRSAQIDLLQATPVGDVWGVGRKLAPQLLAKGIATAWDLACQSPVKVRQQWSTVLARTVQELQGIPCMPMEAIAPPAHQVAHTRSFGETVSQLDELLEAVSHFASQAAAKARAQQLLAGHIYVFAHTSPQKPLDYWECKGSVPLHPASADTFTIVSAARRVLAHIYQPSHAFMKAGVVLLDMRSAHLQTQELWDSPNAEASSRLMQAMDLINAQYGPGTLRLASTGLPHQPRARWHLRQAMRSPLYTMSYSDLPVASA